MAHGHYYKRFRVFDARAEHLDRTFGVVVLHPANTMFAVSKDRTMQRELDAQQPVVLHCWTSDFERQRKRKSRILQDPCYCTSCRNIGIARFNIWIVDIKAVRASKPFR